MVATRVSSNLRFYASTLVLYFITLSNPGRQWSRYLQTNWPCRFHESALSRSAIFVLVSSVGTCHRFRDQFGSDVWIFTWASASGNWHIVRVYLLFPKPWVFD